MMKQFVWIAALVLAASSSRGDVPTYSVDFLGAGWTATGINEAGDICGSVSPDGTTLLAGVSHGGLPFELLPLPPGMQSSRAHDINDAGVVVGSVCPNQYVVTQPTAAVWRPGPGGYTVEVLHGLPGDPYSAAYAVNDLGDVIGGSGFWGWNLSTGVLFTDDGPVALPGGMMGVDVNNERVVLSGNRLLDLDTQHITEVALPPGNWQGFVGAAINVDGDFCGYIAGYSGCSTFPIRYRQGVGWEFLGGCATTTSATAINDNGDALLYYYMTTAGVSFVPEGYFALGSLIDPGAGEYYIQYGGANGINNRRQIIAGARQGFSGPIGAVLMTPMNQAGLAEGGAEGGARAYPNPSRGAVQLTIPGGRAANETWSVFDATGRLRAAFHGDTWDATDRVGSRVPAGVYVLRRAEDGEALRVTILPE